MSTCDWLDLETLGSRPIVPNNLPRHWCEWVLEIKKHRITANPQITGSIIVLTRNSYVWARLAIKENKPKHVPTNSNALILLAKTKNNTLNNVEHHLTMQTM